MSRLSKNEKRNRLVLAILIGVAIGLLIILGICFISAHWSDWLRAILAWLIHFAPAVGLPTSSFSSTAQPVTAVASPSTPQFASPLPLAATSTLSSATYTELFSSIGFDDTTDTTAYEDHVATTISLVPDFSVSPTNALFTPAPVTPVGENLSGSTVTKNGDIYTATIPAFPNLVVTSSYAGILRFGYDPSTQKTLIIYAAYESRVLEMGPTGLIADYSARFGATAFAGNTFGAHGEAPVIFSQDGAWWIFSIAGTTKPNLIKIQDGAVIDYAKAAFPDERMTLAAATPGPAPHEIYVKGGLGSYILTDNGFKQAPVQWESSKLNEWDGNVAQGEITSVEDSAAFDAGAGVGTAGISIPVPSYFLSNDGGVTWVAATPGEPVAFSALGGDFRFKVKLAPAGGASGASSVDPYATPWTHIVRLEYWVARSAL